MPTVAVPSEDKRQEIRYFMANDRAALLYLNNLGCIDHNPWPSRRDNLEHPDYFFFDLDPTEGTEYSTVVAVALAVLKKLQTLGLTVFLKDVRRNRITPCTSRLSEVNLWFATANCTCCFLSWRTWAWKYNS